MVQWTVTTWWIGKHLVGRCRYLVGVFFSGYSRRRVSLTTHVNLMPRAAVSRAILLLRLYVFVTLTGQNPLYFSSLHLFGVSLEHHEQPQDSGAACFQTHSFSKTDVQSVTRFSQLYPFRALLALVVDMVSAKEIGWAPGVVSRHNTTFQPVEDISVTKVLQCLQCSIFNLYAPCILYIGQTYRYSPEYTFYIFSQQIHLIIFFRLSLAIFVYSSTKCRVFPYVTLLGHKIFTFYINVVLNCECPAPGSKG